MSEFPPGFAIIYDGQRYVALGTTPAARKDGRPIALVRWSTFCPACDQPFEVTTPLVTDKLTRRCDHCKQRGKSITDDERARIQARRRAE